MVGIIVLRLLTSQEHSYTSLARRAINQEGQFDCPTGLLIDSSNNLLVCDRFNNRVQQFSLDGRFTGKSITHLPEPRGIAATPDGRILVTTPEKVFILK